MDAPSTPRVNLKRLRNFGWNYWDPIGLLGPNGFFAGKWSDEHNLRFADEYDSYLIEAAHKLRRGRTPEEVINYLVDIEGNHMGLSERSDSKVRAEAVVTAIAQDHLVWAWPDKNGSFK